MNQPKYIIEKLRGRKEFLQSNVIRFNKNVNDRIGDGLVKHWISECYCLLRFGCSPDDYFRYEFFKKSNYERNKFITYRRSKRIIKTYNDPRYIQTLNDKTEFNRFFHAFIHRDWLDLRNASEQAFTDFVMQHGEVIMKPLCGGQGKGIFKLTASELENGLFELEHYKDYIAEEILHQHSRMAALNPTSVNTVRVLTFKGEIIACALRTGGEKAIVDNLHSKGVCAHIDIEHGIVDALCVNMRLDKYLFHPVTREKLVGYELPNWELLKERVQEAAAMVPQVAYIGWDVCILDDDIALIEGNHDPGHDVVQMIAQTGLYDAIRDLERKEN